MGHFLPTLLRMHQPVFGRAFLASLLVSFRAFALRGGSDRNFGEARGVLARRNPAFPLDSLLPLRVLRLLRMQVAVVGARLVGALRFPTF